MLIMGKNIYVHVELYACCRDGTVKENHRPTKTAQKKNSVAQGNYQMGTVSHEC